ncbi:AraC family transcriptional regulator [Candidatus Woesearchaeota archaeon]|nr:AraC family transcriptional regulator [Candidatus Woesearchaeota archaeon]
MTKYINEFFFDRDSPEKWYILGAALSCYSSSDGAICFRSQHRDLVRIVMDALESGHTLSEDPREKSSYWFGAMGCDHLIYRLSDYGLDKPKNKRGFPDVPEQYIDDFVRGVIDARANIHVSNGRTTIYLRGNKTFLLGLNNSLRRYAGVERDRPVDGRLTYLHSDAKKIYEFIYRNFDRIKRDGIYLPSKKKLYATAPVPDVAKQRVARKIEAAKKLILKGKSTREAASKAGYSTVTAFYRAFKKATGQTLKEWKTGRVERLHKEQKK